MKRPRRIPTTEQLLDRLPAGLRPKLSKPQLVALSTCNHVNLDAIATGKAQPSILWDFLGGVLMWHRAAELMGVGVAEMAPQLEVATRLVERYSRTGRVAFDGPDYQLAKYGVMVMDELAKGLDYPTAQAAAEWAQAECDRMAAVAADQQRAAA